MERVPRSMTVIAKRSSKNLSLLTRLLAKTSTAKLNYADIPTNIVEEITGEINNNNKEPDVVKIMNLLKTYPQFLDFLNYYQIPERAVCRALYHLKIEKHDPKRTIFSMGDTSNDFYIILKGSIVVRELVMRINGYIIRDKIVLKEGSCFGEFGLLYNAPRSQSIISVSHTTLISIPLDAFRQYLHIHMLKAETDRRHQLCALIPFLNDISFNQYLQIYRNFVFMKIDSQKYVFHEEEKADAIFLILEGRCRLIKHDQSFMSIGKNCMSGLEAVNYHEEDRIHPKYSYSLYAVDDLIVVKIRMHQLGIYCKKFCNSLWKIKQQKDNILNNLIKVNKEQKEKFHVRYREETIKYNSKHDCPLITEKDKKDIDLTIQDCYIKRAQALNLKSTHSLKMKCKITKNVIIPQLAQHEKKKKVKNNSIILMSSTPLISQMNKQKFSRIPSLESSFGHDAFITTINTNKKIRKKLWEPDNTRNDIKATMESDVGLRNSYKKNRRTHSGITICRLGKKIKMNQLGGSIGNQVNDSIHSWNEAYLSKKQYNSGKYKIPLMCLSYT